MGLLVVGMHRSGTSAVTEALVEAGLELPSPERLVGADASNPRGHFEVASLVSLSEEILAERGGSWAVPLRGAGGPAEVEAFAHRFHDLLLDEFSSDRWVLKDPRLCLTGGVVRSVFEREPDGGRLGDMPEILLVLRSPLDVAASLQRRNGLPTAYGLALWERYHRELLAWVSGLDVTVVGYADLLRGETTLVREVASSVLGAEADLGATVDPALASPAAHSDGGVLSPELSRLHEALESCGGRHTNWYPPDAGPETPNLELAFETMAASRSLVEANERLRDRAAGRFVLAGGPPPPPGVLRKAGLRVLGEGRYRRLSDNEILGGASRRLSVANAERMARRIAKERSVTVEPSPEAFGVVDAITEGRLGPPVSIVVPIHDAHDEVERCLAAIERHTSARHPVVLVDDASTDPRIWPMLEGFARRRPGSVLVSNTTNLGFTASVNRGLAARPDGDVVLLNSDTVVTPGWLTRLSVAVHEAPGRASATALSNSAGVFSFGGEVPASDDEVVRVSRLVARTTSRVRPAGPTGNGFCMLITAEARDVVPELDADAFPRGYGEENDYCMRLVEAGYTHVVANDCAVFHSDGASFGDEREGLSRHGHAVLAERYPDYDERARAFVASEAFRDACATAADRVAAGGGGRRRVLHVVHASGGGTAMHLADLAGASGGEVEAFRLLAQPDRLELARHDGAAWVHLESFSRPGGWQLPRRSSRHEAAVVAEVITREAIELVHVQHLLGHTRDVLTVPRALDVPVVLTAHDYYLACPSHTLIDAEGHFCDGVCTPGESDCPLPSICEPRAVRLKHDHVHAWRRTMAEAVSGVDRVVSPSEDAAERLRRLLSETGAELPPWTVIEHGIDLGPRSSAARHPRADEPIRLVLVGAIGSHKGAEMLAALGELGEERNVLVEVLGELGPEVDRDRVRFHGGYERHELPRRLHEIRPTFVGILSGGAETFCYVVSEAWSCGVPVLVGPLGAPADRVRATGAGIVAPSLEPADVIQSAISGGRDAVRYALLAAAAGRAPVRSVADMAQDHLSVYDEVCDHRRESLHHEGGAGPDRPSHVGWA